MGHMLDFSHDDVFVSLNIVSISANSVDPDEMHSVAFHQGLHCLQKYPLWFFPVLKGLTSCHIYRKI